MKISDRRIKQILKEELIRETSKNASLCIMSLTPYIQGKKFEEFANAFANLEPNVQKDVYEYLQGRVDPEFVQIMNKII